MRKAGSSPRVWGQGSLKNIFRFHRRIIPTRVGTSMLSVSAYIKPWDHPHACGDKFHNLKFDGSFLGSSPRVWGQDDMINQAFDKNRIIPTRVGTRYRPHCRSVVTQDHPHACGDKTKEIKENSGFAKSTA